MSPACRQSAFSQSLRFWYQPHVAQRARVCDEGSSHFLVSVTQIYSLTSASTVEFGRPSSLGRSSISKPLFLQRTPIWKVRCLIVFRYLKYDVGLPSHSKLVRIASSQGISAFGLIANRILEAAVAPICTSNFLPPRIRQAPVLSLREPYAAAITSNS